MEMPARACVPHNIQAISMTRQSCQEPAYVMQSETCLGQALHTSYDFLFSKKLQKQGFSKSVHEFEENYIQVYLNPPFFFYFAGVIKRHYHCAK